jgi:uncharacterized protein YegP (UPF0339 family)
MKKKYHFLIKDARGGFRVHQVAPNGEIINSSQVLDTVDNVYKNMIASGRIHNLTAYDDPYKSMEKRRGVINSLIYDELICVVYEGKKNIGLAL